MMLGHNQKKTDKQTKIQESWAKCCFATYCAARNECHILIRKGKARKWWVKGDNNFSWIVVIFTVTLIALSPLNFYYVFMLIIFNIVTIVTVNKTCRYYPFHAHPSLPFQSSFDFFIASLYL